MLDICKVEAESYKVSIFQEESWFLDLVNLNSVLELRLGPTRFNVLTQLFDNGRIGNSDLWAVKRNLNHFGIVVLHLLYVLKGKVIVLEWINLKVNDFIPELLPFAVALA